ncbi:DUF1127 domain-containing protein [Labrys wisconsinensis]|uniref:Uncharacterized protein YjiS (DUF1127 family) n=1 Tax=Labrys wisconsinensis TaxID=425677 RepID=A0ABU0J1J7_9HYPH|nr:DUF1127 domain-containing protein [Labrys wisconsinensis]MDQ0468130.1 uncharacterized protein YjiS (DUF1127 family) [Labrys wisconsinensis]
MLIATSVSALIARMKAYMAYRRTYRELSRLDDRALNDLGIHAGHIGNLFRADMR